MAKKKKQAENKEAAKISTEELAEIESQVDALGGSDAVEVQDDDNSEAEAELTVEQKLQQEVETSRDDARKNHELYLRALADMENLRKRCQREKEDLAKFGNETLLREILPVADNLERAVEHAVQDEATDGLLEGVRMTLDQFSKVLEKFHVLPVESIGQVFDSAVHQAMGQIETEDFPANTVAQEMQKGYLLNDRLLRPSLVMIAKAPVAQNQEADGQNTDITE